MLAQLHLSLRSALVICPKKRNSFDYFLPRFPIEQARVKVLLDKTFNEVPRIFNRLGILRLILTKGRSEDWMHKMLGVT
jgi:hypothetical protein